MKQPSRWVVFLIALALWGLSPMNAGARELPVIRIGILRDGPAVRFPETREILQQEILALTAAEFDVRFPPTADLDGNWEPARIRVTLTPREAAPALGELRALVGEFANELLSCAWRQRLVAANRPVVEEVTRRALATAMGPPTLDDLANFDFTDEPFDDPLGIAVSWEEKYGKSEPAEAGAEAAEPADPPAEPKSES